MIIYTGIASTTHIDLQRQRMAKSALEGMALQINTKYIPLLIEHDRNKDIWVNLYWEVFQLDDWEFALWIVQWVFENDKDRTHFQFGYDNISALHYSKHLNIDELKYKDKLIIKNKNKLTTDNEIKGKNNLVDLLEKFLDQTNITPDGKVCNVKHFIASSGGLRIEIYSNDHNPPHFHVVSKQRKINARFHLYTLEYINSKVWKISEKDKKKIKYFLESNRSYVNKLHNFYEKKDPSNSMENLNR